MEETVEGRRRGKTQRLRVETNGRRGMPWGMSRQAKTNTENKVRHGRHRVMRCASQAFVCEGKDGTDKGAWGMPRLSEARKDVTSCEKPRGGANIP